MLYTLFNVFYVLVAIAMTVLILMQQGAGASAGAAFGSGASGTVFGARGSANFMSKSTAVLATIFMLMSLGMAIYMHKTSGPVSAIDDLGIMGSAVPAASAVQETTIPSEIPQVEIPAAAEPAPVTTTEVPAAPEPAPIEDPASD